MSEIPSGMEFPEDAISGELYNIFDHTVAYREYEGVDLGGRIVPLGQSEDEDTPLATPTPGQISGKRRRNDSPELEAEDTPAPARKRSAPLALPTPNIDSLPSSSEPPQTRHNELEILEVDLVQLRFPASNELGSPTINSGKQVKHVQGMFQTFNNGDKMLQALQLLAKVSSTTDLLMPALSISATTPFSASLTAAAPLTRMVAASRVARKFLENSDIQPALLRLQTLMCYLTLYLTLEHTIVPQLQHDHADWSSRQIAGRKYSYFYQLLNDSPDGNSDTQELAPAKFRVDISFGKNFWGLLQELGVAALLMLAVGDTGLTVIARAMGPGSESRQSLTSALACSRGWWSFAHAIGPATLRTFFGPRDIPYTIPQLLQQLRNEPLPAASILMINQSCEMREIATGTELPEKELELPPLRWELEIGGTTIPISHHPDVTLARGLKRRNVWDWLESDVRSKPIFEFLLPSTKEDSLDDTVNFFCNFYNRRAIPGRKAVPFPPLFKLSQPQAGQFTYQQRLDTLANEEQSNCDLMVLAAPFDTFVLGVILHPRTTTAIIYNWTENRELDVRVSEVGIYLACIIYIFSSTELTANDLTGYPIHLVSGDRMEN
jgi:hypothetical protein